MTTKERQTLGYDDVELYSWCHYAGRYGWIMDKGDHISPAVGRHILIDFQDSESPATMKLHEKLVNKYLRKQKKLWVDFNEQLGPYVNN